MMTTVQTVLSYLRENQRRGYEIVVTVWIRLIHCLKVASELIVCVYCTRPALTIDMLCVCYMLQVN